jgi:hypothetical protein
MIARIALAAVLALLSACGGGDHEDEHTKRPAVNCEPRPELCI